MVRVVYRLRDETKKGEKEKSYALVRQESEQLDYAKFKSGGDIKEYVLIDGIKSFTIEYSALIEKKEEATQTEGMARREQPPKRAFEIKKMNVWNIESAKEEKKEQQLPLFPQLVTIKLIMYDAQKRSVEVPLSYAINSSPVPPQPGRAVFNAPEGISKLPDIMRKLVQGAPPPPSPVARPPVSARGRRA